MLSFAEIRGNLECVEGKFQNPPKHGAAESGVALSIDRAKVGGHVLLNNCTAEGQVVLLAAEIAGTFECIGGKIQNPAIAWISESGRALQAQSVRVGGAVLLRKLVAEGEVRLWGAHIGPSLECDEGTFRNPGGKALDADAMKVSGPVYFRNGFSAEGQVTLAGAEIGENFDCSRARFQHPATAEIADSGTALNAEGVKVAGSILLRDNFLSEGQVCLKGAQVGGNLECHKSKFQNPLREKLLKVERRWLPTT